jgi:hypothetical protein
MALVLEGPWVLAGQPVDVLAARNEAGPKVCLVTADGPLGLPAAYASGFLLGDGKFVITDLASVSRPGVKQITARFRDGSTAVGRQFGMADPAIGLAAIALDQPKTDVGGLAIAAALPGENDEAVLLGWKWAKDLDLVKGMVRNGAAAADLATVLKLDPPKVAATFLTFASPRMDIATGAPLLDASGVVVGVLIDLTGVDKTIVVPAPLLRSALLSAGAQLRPLAELPKPYWPVNISALSGRPVTPAEFAAAARAAKIRSRCAKCDGKGSIVLRKLTGYHTVGGMVRPIYRDIQEQCPTCKGETVVCNEGLYAIFADMARDAWHLVASPDIDPKAKDAATNTAASMLAALARVGQRYRDAFVSQSTADLAKGATESPRGIVVYAQVGENIAGPDGQYTLISPFRSGILLAVKADRFSPPAGEGKPAAGRPATGQWIILGGEAQGAVTLPPHRPILVNSFGWSPGPSLGRGPGPTPVGPGPGPSDQPPPKKPASGPDFFGL